MAILDQISDTVLVFDKNIRLIGVNNSAEQLFGLPADTILGKPCWELFGFSTSESDSPALDLQLSTRESWCLPNGNVRLRLENGLERRVVIKTIELLDQSGALESVVATVTEVTESSGEASLGSRNGRHRDDKSVNGARKAGTKYHPIVIRNRRLAAVLGAILLLMTAGVASIRLFWPGKGLTPEQQKLLTAEQEKREAAAKFNALTPAEHLERAKWGLRKGAPADAVTEGLGHLKGIPAYAPEAGPAKTLEKDLTRAGNLANARDLISSSSSEDLRNGMEKLERANGILEGVTQQYPGDPDAARLSRDAQSAAEQLAVKFPQEFASLETKLVNFSWEKGGFGTVMIANFTIRNDSPIDVGDLKIRCTHSDPSGIVTDQNAGTAYGVVKSRSTTRLPNVNMGFLNSTTGGPKSSKTDCEIVGLKLGSQSQSFGSAR